VLYPFDASLVLMGEAPELNSPEFEPPTTPVSDWDSDQLSNVSSTSALTTESYSHLMTTLPPSILVRLQVALLPSYVMIPPVGEALPSRHLHPVTDTLLEFTPLTKGNWDRQLLRSFQDTPAPFLCYVLEFFQKVQAHLDQVYQFEEENLGERPRWVVNPDFKNETAFRGGGHQDFGEDILLYRYEAQFAVRPSCNPWLFTTDIEGPHQMPPWPPMNLFGRCPDFKGPSPYLLTRYPSDEPPTDEPKAPRGPTGLSRDLRDSALTLAGSYVLVHTAWVAYQFFSRIIFRIIFG